MKKKFDEFDEGDMIWFCDLSTNLKEVKVNDFCANEELKKKPDEFDEGDMI